MTLPIPIPGNLSHRQRYHHQHPPPVIIFDRDEEGDDDNNEKGRNEQHDCRVIVPSFRFHHHHQALPRLRLPFHLHMNYYPNTDNGTNHHIHFLEETDEEVTCRALVLHPTKYNRDLHKTAGGGPVHMRAKATIDWLARETLSHVFRFLPAQSLCAAECVCPLWRELASKDDAYWSELCQLQYGISPENFQPPPDPVKLLYMLSHASFAEIKYGGGGGASRGAGGAARRMVMGGGF